MQKLYSVNRHPSDYYCTGRPDAGLTPRANPPRFSALFLATLLLPAAALAAVESTDPEWCANYRVSLADSPDTGRVVVHTALLAHMRISVPVNPVKVTLSGIGNHLPILTSDVQCANLVVFNQVPPGEYRLQSMEGNVSVFTAPERFLFPLPGDGYRLIFTGGQSALYRVTVPRDLAAIIDVRAGETSFAGKLTTLVSPRHPWSVGVEWDHQLATQIRVCENFNATYELTGKNRVGACSSVGASSGASPGTPSD